MSQARPSRASNKRTGSNGRVRTIGAVPKRAPKYLSAFLKFVADQAEDDEAKRALQSDRRLTTWFTKHWVPFVNKVEEHRPRKKQRTDEPYNEQKLSKDAKAIIAKLETMKTHIGQLDANEAQDQLELIHHLSSHILRKVTHAASNGNVASDSKEAPDETPIDDVVMQTDETMTLPPSGSENNDTQTMIKPELSMLNLPPPLVLAPRLSVVAASASVVESPVPS